MPLTCKDLEDRIMPDITPGDIDLFYRILTEADERLLDSGKWQWTRTGIDLFPVNGIIELDDEFESIVGAKIGCSGTGVSWQEVRFIDGNYSKIGIEGCSSGLYDRGLIAGVRTYEVGPHEVDEVVALVRYAPRLLRDPEDIPVCQNAAAIKQMMLAILYENSNDLEKSMGYVNLAMRTLDLEESAYRGAARKIKEPRLFEPARRRSRHNFP